MCDRCRTIRSRVESKIREVIEEFDTNENKEAHMAQILRDDPSANAAELRKAFTSIGPNFHVAMQAAKVVMELVLEAHNYDTVQTLVAFTELQQRVQAERHRLLHMETPSGGPPTRPM